MNRAQELMTATRNKSYLGDGAYIQYDGYSLILTTEDGCDVQNEIWLEPLAYLELVRYATARYEEGTR